MDPLILAAPAVLERMSVELKTETHLPTCSFCAIQLRQVKRVAAGSAHKPQPVPHQGNPIGAHFLEAAVEPQVLGAADGAAGHHF